MDIWRWHLFQFPTRARKIPLGKKWWQCGNFSVKMGRSQLQIPKIKVSIDSEVVKQPPLLSWPKYKIINMKHSNLLLDVFKPTTWFKQEEKPFTTLPGSNIGSLDYLAIYLFGCSRQLFLLIVEVNLANAGLCVFVSRELTAAQHITANQ